MLDIVTGIYSILLGVSLVIFWIIAFYKRETKKYIEIKLERYFHIIAEFVMSILAFISGIAILFDQRWGIILFLLTMGFMIYATINAVGIYAHKKFWLLVTTLIGIAIISTILIIFNFAKLLS